jgi:glucose-1-phosphate cytidylyltransferase
MKVLILCGGKGIRLRPLTEEIPKPMVYLKNKPIIEHILDFYTKNGFKDFILAIGYKGEQIKEHIDKKKGRNVEYVDSGDAGILQRICDARDLVSDPFIVSYGDTIADVDIKKLLKFHKSHEGLITITTYQIRSQFGVVFSKENGLVYSFKEKPVLDLWMNIGFMVFEKKALNFVEEDDDIISFLNRLAGAGKVYEYKHRGKHITINTEKEWMDAKKEIKTFYTLRD